MSPTEWSGGTGGLARILYRDGQAVGMVDSPEIAAEIVEALNTIDSARRVWERVSADGRVREWTNVGDPPPESGRERSLPLLPDVPIVRRLRSCVEAWPDCYTGGYDPMCCRFPKSCSATVYDPEHVTDDQLEP